MYPGYMWTRPKIAEDLPIHTFLYMNCLYFISQNKLTELERMASYRKTKLNDNSAFLQFNWKADVVESWIGEG